MLSDRTEKLKRLHQTRRERTYQLVNDAIQYLICSGQPVNFNSVALTACVAKKTLYNHPDLRARIEELREQEFSKQFCIAEDLNNENKDKIISVLIKKITKLEADNKHLREQLKLTGTASRNI
ncbi:DUF6262 family protein [Dendrosporobacter sp. 1207_IL3150]|uniref:DUF6262 family protein n=1 Tax=Dendrosporobacter sp. 1207_IL3150 TaxID=3084054 RepID=UPI002FDB1E1F